MKLIMFKIHTDSFIYVNPEKVQLLSSKGLEKHETHIYFQEEDHITVRGTLSSVAKQLQD